MKGGRKLVIGSFIVVSLLRLDLLGPECLCTPSRYVELTGWLNKSAVVLSYAFVLP